jgi:capsule polysaccharide export protein KpsE/RkpR
MMDEKKLEEMYRATMENNSMLRSMRRQAFVGGIFKFVWWIVILVVLPYLTWLYLEPYLSTILAQYQALQEQSGMVSTQAADLQKQIESLGGGIDFQKLLEQFTGGGQ